MFNQKQISKLSVATLIELKAVISGTVLGADNIVCYCAETNTLYKYLTDASALTGTLDKELVITGDNVALPNSRWVGIAGNYAYYNKTISGLSSTNVKEALDELSVLSVDILIWDGAVEFGTFYTANSISTLTRTVIVSLLGTGHTISATPGTDYTNCDKLLLVGDINSPLTVDYTATAAVFNDELPHLYLGVIWDHSSATHAACAPLAKSPYWYIGDKCEVIGGAATIFDTSAADDLGVTLGLHGKITPGGVYIIFEGIPVLVQTKPYIFNYYSGSHCGDILGGFGSSTLTQNIYSTGIYREQMTGFAGTVTLNYITKATNEGYTDTYSIGADNVQEAIDIVIEQSLNSPVVFMDDFLGIERGEWATRVSTGSVSFADVNGWVTYTTGLLLNDEESKDFDDLCFFQAGKYPEFEVGLGALTSYSDTDLFLGLINVANTQYIRLAYDHAGLVWKLQVSDGTHSMDVATSLAISGENVLKVYWASSTVLALSIDGVTDVADIWSLATYSINMAGTDAMQPYRGLKNVAAAGGPARRLELDYFKIWQNR